ncbi:hypothetical protein KUTeg_022598 [Tegillarca granosa]|uniref:DUF3730 domain-containing protein n=1 Tax=Tegillarca granosa TaxID=220873 RepID=A0ABQ9E5Z4_TEGGR|nr:hypothetical protein KUTeg_022598 [Tegillarca granosa]
MNVEVDEIRSAWTVLADRLSQETRPVVVEKICDLFSLVPALEVQTPEYESFAADILRRLWLFTQVENGTVSSAAFQALSLFKADEFKLSHFPQQYSRDFIKQAQTIAEQQEQPDLTLDQIIDFVPGICYIRLMRQLETGVLKALVAKEVENLPRGIYHSSLRRQGTAANQGKAIGSIPSFVLSHLSAAVEMIFKIK